MKLNALLKTLGFLALAATPVVAGPSAPVKNPIAPAPPANDDLGIIASIGYDSNYVWRGINYGQHWVRAGLNGAIPLVGGASEDGAGSTSLLWDVNYGSLAGDQDSFSPTLPAFFGIPTTASFQRLQLGAAVSHDLGPVSVSFGYSFIHNMGLLANGSGLNNGVFPFGGGYGMNDIQQLTLGVSTNLGPVVVASSANYDLFNGGWYFDLTAKSNIAVTDAISIVPHAGLGYGLNYNAGFTQASRNLIGGGGLFGQSAAQGGISGWTALNVGIDFPIKLNSRATLTPYVAFNLPMGPFQNLARSSTQPYFPGFGGGPATAFHSVAYYGVTLSVRF
jgi:hypothetical protein